jgi:hypothetical protein
VSEIEVGLQGNPAHGCVTTRTKYLDFYVLNRASEKNIYVTSAYLVLFLDESCKNVPIRCVMPVSPYVTTAELLNGFL